MSNSYHFITHWHLRAGIQEVADILSDAPALVRWWPSVYLDVQELEHGDERRVGTLISLYTKGWLPYTLRWHGRVTAANYPYGFTIDVWGDFSGRGVWKLRQVGDFVHVIYDWRIKANKPLLRLLSPVLRPVFAANHRWAMDKGEESIKLELARRRARTAQELAIVPAPPRAMWPRGTRRALR